MLSNLFPVVQSLITYAQAPHVTPPTRDVIWYNAENLIQQRFDGFCAEQDRVKMKKK